MWLSVVRKTSCFLSYCLLDWQRSQSAQVATMIDNVMKGFDWESRSVPMSRPLAAYSSIAVYLSVVFLLKKCIQRPVQVPTAIAASHNLILCLGSLVMFVGTAYESLKVGIREGSGPLQSCHGREDARHG